MKNGNPSDLVSALGSVIQERRRELHISQEQLAARAGLHRTYISEIERRSRNLSVKILVQISEALHLEPSALMRMAEEATTSGETKLSLIDNAKPSPTEA